MTEKGPKGILLKLGPSVRTSMMTRLVKEYPELENQVDKNTSKTALESILRQKGNVFKAYLIRMDSDNASTYSIIPVELRKIEGDDLSPIINYKSFVTNLKYSTASTMNDYGNDKENLTSSEFEQVAEKEKTILSNFLADPKEFAGCNVHVAVISSAPELSEDEGSFDPDITPKYKSLNILEGSRYGKNIKLPKYNRTDNSDIWCDKCVIIFELSGVKNPVRQISQLITELTDDLQDQVLTELASAPAKTIEEFKAILRRCARLSDNEISRSLAALKFDERTHKSFRNFYYKVKSLIQSQLPEGTESSLVDKVTTREFMSKCPEVVSSNTYFRNFPTSDVNRLIELADNIYADAKKPKSSTELNYFPKPKTGTNTKGKKDGYCHIHKSSGHSTDDCFLNPKNPKNKLSNGKDNSGKNWKDTRGPKKEVVCYRCNMKGHIASKCRNTFND